MDEWTDGKQTRHDTKPTSAHPSTQRSVPTEQQEDGSVPFSTSYQSVLFVTPQHLNWETREIRALVLRLSSSMKAVKRLSSQLWLAMHCCTTSSWPGSSAACSMLSGLDHVRVQCGTDQHLHVAPEDLPHGPAVDSTPHRAYDTRTQTEGLDPNESDSEEEEGTSFSHFFLFLGGGSALSFEVLALGRQSIFCSPPPPPLFSSFNLENSTVAFDCESRDAVEGVTGACQPIRAQEAQSEGSQTSPTN
ncbi:hypothetical protein EYF80_007385 [Liparis tanakae]|uniref:Uncharacterized protein n=1 Tax=Liparis tanakae TaxID=230148 RepID=A0A4Z2IWC1_9TELE|nr:hypothetical protein EYF80_007385 [Liparis tanakae]